MPSLYGVRSWSLLAIEPAGKDVSRHNPVVGMDRLTWISASESRRSHNHLVAVLSVTWLDPVGGVVAPLLLSDSLCCSSVFANRTGDDKRGLFS
jgi:hypothetical protein